MVSGRAGIGRATSLTKMLVRLDARSPRCWRDPTMLLGVAGWFFDGLSIPSPSVL